MSIRRRPVKVATVSHRPGSGVAGPSDVEPFLKATAPWFHRASRMGADLIAFPEVYPQLAVADPWHHAEPTDAGTLPGVCALAEQYRMIVVWPRLEYDADRGVRNCAVLVGGDGKVIGRYDKMFPTVVEMDKGVIPGAEAPCFETDIGRVGILICFDMNFPEVRESLTRAKPDVLVFPSMYRGGLQAQALAFESGAFVVTAISSELGLIVDRCGRVVKESTYEALAVAPINTNSVALHMDRNQDKMDAMLAKYGPALTFDFHTREAFLVIEYAGDRDIGELVREFDLETADAYFTRSRDRRKQALERFRAGVQHPGK